MGSDMKKVTRTVSGRDFDTVQRKILAQHKDKSLSMVVDILTNVVFYEVRKDGIAEMQDSSFVRAIEAYNLINV